MCCLIRNVVFLPPFPKQTGGPVEKHATKSDAETTAVAGRASIPIFDPKNTEAKKRMEQQHTHVRKEGKKK